MMNIMLSSHNLFLSPSLFSAIAAGLSAVTTIASVFISHRSFKHQKQKDEINLLPNLFIKGKDLKIKNDVRYYDLMKFLDNQPELYDYLPFKFIEIKNLSHEEIVDVHIDIYIKNQFSNEQLSKLKSGRKQATYFFKDNSDPFVFNVENKPQNNSISNKVSLINGKETLFIELPIGIYYNLWQFWIYNLENEKSKKSITIPLIFKLYYSHGYSSERVKIKKELNFIVYLNKSTNDEKDENTLSYDSLVFPKRSNT